MYTQSSSSAASGVYKSQNQDIRIQALAARRVLSRMESSGARVNLMFLARR